MEPLVNFRDVSEKSLHQIR